MRGGSEPAGGHRLLDEPRSPQRWSRIEAADERTRIASVIDKMSDTLRIPLVLRDMDEMSYQEIADVLKIGLSAVKMRIKRGREEFRRRYKALLLATSEREERAGSSTEGTSEAS